MACSAVLSNAMFSGGAVPYRRRRRVLFVFTGYLGSGGLVNVIVPISCIWIGVSRVRDPFSVGPEVQGGPVPGNRWPTFAENGVSAGLGVKVPSLLQRAVSVSAAARFGPLREYELQLQSPWRLMNRTWFDAKYNYRDRPNELDHFREHADEVEIRAGATVGKDWRIGGRFAFISLESDKPGSTLSPDNRDRTPALGALLEYDGRDLRSNPHKGWHAIVDISQNGGWLGGDGDFRTAQFDVRRYQPLGARHVLALFSFELRLTGGQDGVR
jgi:hypothetical protein